MDSEELGGGGGGERVISVSSSDSGSEGGDEVAALPDGSSSPLKASSPRGSKSASSSSGQRRRRTIYIAGRPPWYDSQGQIAEAFVIGLAGGSASGKTTVARRIIESLGIPWVSLLSMDSFYKVLTPEQNRKAAENEYNFDCPAAFDLDLLEETLQKLKEGKHVEIPVYDFSTHARAKYRHTMYGANVVVFEGIMAFSHPPLLKLMDLKIFVDTDSDIRLARRLRRDITERGRDLEGVLKQYNKFVKPAFHQFIEPTMQYADIVVPRGGQNRVAVQLIVEHVKDQLKKRGFNNRPKLLAVQRDLQTLPASVHILPNKSQVKAMHTVIRNKDTKREEFVFFTNRLACLAMEYAHSFLPFKDVLVTTPQGDEYSGKRFAGKLCGVSIMRAGEVLEPALLSVCKEATIGKILIQTNETTDEPALHFLRLPSDISQRHVILMDATIATGAAAIMAIRILLDHDVAQENIIFVTILSAKLGVQTLAYSFPRVRIITTAIDPKVSRDYHILPGVGNYGDRYFGTEPD